MTAHEEALAARLDAIQGISPDEVKTPDMPMDTCAQEAMYLHKWVQADKDVFIARNFDWTLVDDLPGRVMAAVEAQSLWNNVRWGREEAMKQWQTASPAGFVLRDDLLNEFRYAYHNHDDLKTRVAAVAEGAGDADMLQDLNDLAVIGRENFEPLKETNFDFDLLELAAEKCRTLGELRANASVDKEAYKAQKLLRNQAYTHLEQAVDEIRRAGKFLLRKNDDRLKGYSSSYKRRARQTEMNTEPEVTETLGRPEEAADTETKTA